MTDRYPPFRLDQGSIDLEEPAQPPTPVWPAERTDIGGSLAEGRATATKVLESFPTCLVAEIARLGRTLRSWQDQFLAYFTTGRASNGGTQAINGIIELHRRVARGFRNPRNYRLRMILAAGRITHPNLR